MTDFPRLDRSAAKAQPQGPAPMIVTDGTESKLSADMVLVLRLEMAITVDKGEGNCLFQENKVPGMVVLLAQLGEPCLLNIASL
jgi:hypothetical protein